MSLEDRELVVFSPLPPCVSGIGAYVAEQLPELGRHMRTVVVVPREAEVAPVEGAEVIGLARYRRAGWLRQLPHIHHMGNNLDHAHVYQAARQVPGLLVLHELVLHHVIEQLTLGRGNPHAYAAVLAACHGPAGLRLARLKQLGLHSPWQRFLLPLHEHLVEASRGVVVHSRYAAQRLHPSGPLPVHVVPHHASPQVAAHDGLSRAEARARLGLPADGPIITSLGYATRAKQVQEVLRALALLKARGIPCHYVVAGKVVQGFDVAGLVRELDLSDRVTLTGWLPEDAFFAHARAADLLMALRFPVGGESSGALARALAMGLPALAYDFGPMAEYPEDVVARLPFTPEPAEPLARRLAELLADPAGLAERGRRAAEYARREMTVSAAVAGYLQAVRACL